MNLPVEFKEKMKKFLGDEWDDFLYCYENDRYQALRFNTLKKGLDASRYEAVLKKIGVEKVTPVDWAENGYYYDEETARPGKHPYHEMGLYYIQEPSAMSAASLLKPEPGMRVLDLCAAPGGKSTQLASYLGQEGLLVSNEINNARCKILSSNIERMGVRNAVVTNEDSGKLARHFPSFFHAVLVDAPCSGEGMFRKNPDAMNEWSLEQVLVCADRQYEIICNAAVMLMPGGDMVYSTCTFSREENEDLIARFLSTHEDYELVEEKRIMPHKAHGEGHFVAKLHRKGENEKRSKNKNVKAKLTKEEEKSLDEFLSETISGQFADWIKSGKLELYGDQLYRLPDEEINLNGIRVLRAGLHIGEFKKKRFEPSFALALTLGREDVKKYVELPSEDMRALGYFNGQSVIFNEGEIDTKLKGW